MDPRITETLRYLVAAAAVGLLAYLGFNGIRNYRDQGRRLEELRSLTSQSSFFRQFYPADADRALLTAMAVMRESEMGGTAPADLLDKCFHVSKEYLSTGDNRLPADEQLIRRTLTDNYENCRKLGLFAKRESVQRLRKGELPAITNGPSSGDTPFVARVIDPAIAPALDKAVANLEIRPPGSVHAKDDVERAAAHQLTRDLSDSGIIDAAATARIHAALDGKPDQPEPEHATKGPDIHLVPGQVPPAAPTPVPPSKP